MAQRTGNGQPATVGERSAMVAGLDGLAASQGERERELEYTLSSVATEVTYAERQLRLFRDNGRALDALQRALEALKRG